MVSGCYDSRRGTNTERTRKNNTLRVYRLPCCWKCRLGLISSYTRLYKKSEARISERVNRQVHARGAVLRSTQIGLETKKIFEQQPD